MSTDHVVMNTRDGTFVCTHCHEHERIMLPAPIAEVVSKSRDFIDRHARCLPGRRMLPELPTEEQLNSACMNVRHDFGLMSAYDKHFMRTQMLESWRAIAKVVNQ